MIRLPAQTRTYKLNFGTKQVDYCMFTPEETGAFKFFLSDNYRITSKGTGLRYRRLIVYLCYYEIHTNFNSMQKYRL